MKSWVAPITARSLVEEIAARLEAAIIGGELQPGTRLSEQAIAKQFGVSRGPLRESIRRLEGRRLIERTPHVGARVAKLPIKDLEHILVAREALEGMAARLAAEHATAAEIQALGQLLEKHSEQILGKRGEGYYQERHDFDFHFRIIKASRNPQLVKMLCDELYDLLRVYRYKSSTVAGRAEQALAEHRDILKFICCRDAAAAETAMRLHLTRARLALLQPPDHTEKPASPSPAKSPKLQRRSRPLRRTGVTQA